MTFQYHDANGNRTFYDGIHGGTVVGTNGTSYDAQDRLLHYGDDVFTYDDNGSLTSMTTQGQTTLYDYDLIGNLQSVTLPDNTSISYIIDPGNRRIGKEVNGTLVQGFLYKDGINPLVELDETGAVRSRFVYSTKLNVPDYMIKEGVTYRIISDHLGSVRFVINASSSEIAQELDYDEYGVLLKDSNPGFQPFGYAGGLYDHQTGLVRFGARDYMPKIGRWTVKDPIHFRGKSTNFYMYAANNPIVFVDPIGLIIMPGTSRINNLTMSAFSCSGISSENLGKLQDLASNPNYLVVLVESTSELDSFILTEHGAYTAFFDVGDTPAYSIISLDSDYIDDFQNLSPEAALLHELGHAWHHMDPKNNEEKDYLNEDIINEEFDRNSI